MSTRCIDHRTVSKRTRKRYDSSLFNEWIPAVPTANTNQRKAVVGILGPNGMGKSTAINALSGRMIPNLGDWLDKEADWDDVIETFPRGELRDFFVAVRDGKSRLLSNHKMWIAYQKRVKGTVRDLLSKVDERKMFDEMTKKLGIDHLLDRTIQQLSGGELQRMAICATLLRDVDVYFFDEPSSYLDIHERMRIVRIIQDLADNKARHCHRARFGCSRRAL